MIKKPSYLSLGLLRLAMITFAMSCLLDRATATEKAVNSPHTVINGKKQYLKVAFKDDDTIHFEVGDEYDPERSQIHTSPMLLPWNNAGTHTLREASHVGSLESRNLRVLISLKTFCTRVFDKILGKTLVNICPEELGPDAKTLTFDSSMAKNAYGLGQYFRNPGTADGDLIGQTWTPVPGSPGNALRNFNGGANGDIMIPILYVLGQKNESFAIFIDHTYRQKWSLRSKPWRLDTTGKRVSWLVMRGDSLKDLRKKYMALTGHPPVPPREIFGLWLSKFGYSSWDEVYNKVHALRKAKFPLDGMVLDLQWFGGRFYPEGSDVQDSQMGVLRFDEEAFPNPRETLSELRDIYGVKIMPIEEAYISSSLPEHDDLEEKGFLAYDCRTKRASLIDQTPWWGVGGMLDYTNPKASSYWFANKRKALIEMGINFHWTDLGEPEMYDSRSCYHGLSQLGKKHVDVHNIFNLKWTESIWKGYRKHFPDQRYFIMSRSGSAGSQRYGAGFWSGDIAANMGALTAHLGAMTHVTLSGIDYYGSDVGGFHRREEVLDGPEDELYTWWFANSSLFDFPLRPHVWAQGPRDNKTSPLEIGDRDSNLANLRLRYKLLPYYYSLAHHAAENGEPIISPMVYEFQGDPTLREVGHQKMIGPWLMAAVVASYRETHRSVYFPSGNWVSMHNSTIIHGSDQYIRGFPTFSSGSYHLPLFLRPGGIVPMFAHSRGIRNTGDYYSMVGNRIPYVFWLNPSQKSTSFTLVEDDGVSQAYKAGETNRITLSQRIERDKLYIRIDSDRTHSKIPPRPMRLKIFLDQYEIASTKGKGRISIRNEGDHYDIALSNPRQERINLVFELQPKKQPKTGWGQFICKNSHTVPGEAIYVTGNVPALGSYEPSQAVKLDPSAYPHWTGVVKDLPIDRVIQWSCLKRKEVFDGRAHRSKRSQRSFAIGHGGFGGTQITHW